MGSRGRLWICGAVAVLTLAGGCDKKAPPPVVAASDRAQLVELPNGSFAASPGSVESAIAAFLASNAPAPRTFRLDSEQFSPWSDSPSPRTQATLTTIILILRAYPTARVLLTGYTDNVGEEPANQALSLNRAKTLAKLIHEGGIGGNRISVKGAGSSDPVADNATKRGQAANRRIELTITDK